MVAEDRGGPVVDFRTYCCIHGMHILPVLGRADTNNHPILHRDPSSGRLEEFVLKHGAFTREERQGDGSWALPRPRGGRIFRVPVPRAWIPEMNVPLASTPSAPDSEIPESNRRRSK